MHTQLLNRTCMRAGATPRPALSRAIGKQQRLVVLRTAKTEEVEVSTNGASAAVPSNGHATYTPVDFEELSDIIRLVHDTDIVEFELKSKRFNLSVKKKEAMVKEQMYMPMMPSMAPAPVAAAPAPAPTPAPAPAVAAPAPAAPAAPAAPPAVKGIEICSPMGGTFYRKPAPNEPFFCNVGDRIQKGQVVCIVEAMKLMNEIEAEQGGEVVKFLLENGQPVTTGQPIMIIKP